MAADSNFTTPAARAEALEAAKRINDPATRTDTAGFIADAVTVATALDAQARLIEEARKVVAILEKRWPIHVVVDPLAEEALGRARAFLTTLPANKGKTS